ncbi:hypothetical protein ACFL6D_04405 [Spirochaetota bacterium]
MEEHFFAFIPDKPLYEFIMQCKKSAFELAGEQLYLKDTPHLTVYLGHFNDTAKLCTAVSKNVSVPKEHIALAGWHTFFNDPVTQKHTVVIQIAPKSIKALQEIQMSLVLLASEYRSLPCPKRYSQTNGLSKEMKISIEKYGFPFTGNIWFPHFSIASFSPDTYDIIKDMLYKKQPPGETHMSCLVLYSIRNGAFEEIHRWEYN